jgi:hypothetical protein
MNPNDKPQGLTGVLTLLMPWLKWEDTRKNDGEQRMICMGFFWVDGWWWGMCNVVTVATFFR